METAKLFNGLEIHSKVTTVEGAPAVVERKAPDAYTLELDIQARVPQAAQYFGATRYRGPVNRHSSARTKG